MADNLTHSWSDTRTTAKNGINAMIKHNYTFAGINDSVVSVIPPYSQINSATLDGTADKDPNGQTKSGNLYIGFQNTASSVNLQFVLDEKDDLTYKGVESITGVNILSYIKSKTSNAGYIEHLDYNAVRIWAGFTAIYKQGWVTTAKITWNYNEPRAIVTVSKSGEGTVSGAGTYHWGNSYTIKATPATGWKFVKWSDGNTNASRTFTVDSSLITAYETSKSYQAVFEKNTYTLTVTAGTGGTVSGGGTYAHGDTATIKATPNTGYKFVKWNDGNTSATRTVTVTGAATYTATFEKLKYTVTWKNDDGTVLETDNNVEYGTTPTYNGSTPTKPSTAQHTYTFSGWSPAISAVTGNVTYTAQFTATVRKYTVKWYNYDGTLLETDTDVPYGTKPTYNGATPTKPSDDYYNYGFAGWSPSISEGIQGDKNFTAQFAQTDRYYTVRWVNASAVQGVEGALLETDEVKFNTQPDYNGAIPKHPKQDTDPALNYDFIGWSAKVTDPAKPDTELEKIKGDITYTAIYETTPKLYAITVILFNSQSTDIYEYGTELTIEAPEIVDFHRFVKWNDGDTRPSRTVQVTGEAIYSAEYERIPIPIKANIEQVTGCYIVPDTNTIVYVINGTVPTVEIGRESVDGWSFLVSNAIPENGYPLKKLFITDNSGVTTRVY